MKKIVFLLVALLVFAYDRNCLEVAERLRVLQNDIVAKSFKALKPGAWATYKKGKVIYLGRLRSPFTHKVHHVAEVFSPRSMEEVWYDIVKREVVVEGRRYPFWYLHIREAFIVTPHGTFYASPQVIDMFMQMRGMDMTTMFTGPVVPEPRCQHLVKLQNLHLMLPKGKKIEAVKIVDTKDPNRVLLVSDEVPFGMASGLIDFGWSGAKPRLSEHDRRRAKRFASLPVPGFAPHILPGGMF